MHTCVQVLRAVKKVQEWTLSPTSLPSKELSVYLLAELLLQRDESGLQEVMERNTESESSERKMYNDPRCHGYGFWTVLVTRVMLQRRLRTASPVMHHKCITIWEYSAHILQRIEIWAPHKEECLL